MDSKYLEVVKLNTPEKELVEKHPYCKRCRWRAGVCPAPGSCYLYEEIENANR